MRGWRETLLAVCGIVASAQPPAISQNGIMNAAAHTPSALPGGAIARGARFLIHGVRLGANRSDVHVVLQHGGQILKIPVETANSLELDARMPSAAPLGDSMLVVETGEGPSKRFSVPVAASQIGLFALNGRGWGLGKIDNLDTGDHPSPNAPSNPARPGQMTVILTTGLGNARKVALVIGGRPALVAHIQRDFEPGVERIQFRIPTDVPLGCFVPVYARTPGASLSNIVTMAIAAPGSECSQSQPSLLSAAAESEGLVALTRTATLFGEDRRVVTEDQAHAAFVRIGPSALNLSPLSMLPPAGQCNGLTGDYHTDLESLVSFPAMAGVLNGKELDAGMVITLMNGVGASRRVPRSRGSLGSYWSTLGVDNPSLPRAPALFLQDADFTIAGGGGPDVEAFSRTWPGPANVEWINQNSFQTVDRSRSATFLWQGAPHDAIILLAMMSVDDQAAAGAICFCTARADAGRLTVPTEMFAHFPATPVATNQSASMMMAIRRRVEAKPAIRGLDGLVLVSTFVSVRRSGYR